MPAGAVAMLSWVAAIVFAAVVLGFTGYEVTWKLRRLRRERGRLSATFAELGQALPALGDGIGAPALADVGLEGGAVSTNSVRLR